MVIVLFIVAVVFSVGALCAHFSQAFIDPHNLETAPSRRRVWIYAIGCTGLVYLAAGCATAGQNSAALLFIMAALGTVASPAIADPVKFSSAEITDPWKRRLENFRMWLSGAAWLKLITLLGSLLSSAVVGSAWICVLALVGCVSVQSRASVLRGRLKGHEQFHELNAVNRVRVMQRMIRQALVASFAYVLWVGIVGVMASDIEGFSPWNWNGYVGLAWGAIVGAVGISDT